MGERRPAVIAAGIVLGAALMWNVSNVGAVAQTLSDTYGVSLAAIGLLTTAMFVTHMLIQLPAGMLADRFGPRRVALVATCVIVLGNGLLLLDDSYTLAVLARAMIGLGSGSAFVSGLDLVRAGGGGPVASGLFGGITTAFGGVALMVIPPLGELGDWRAPYWSAELLMGVALVVLLACGAVRPTGRARGGLLADLRLVPLCVLHAATFGLNVIAAAWVVTLLERQGSSSTVAGVAGGAILLAGAVSRPAGGLVVARGRHRLVTLWSLLVMGAAAVLLAADVPAIAAAVAALAFGLAAGLPWVGLYATAQRLRPDGPAAAIAFVNVVASFTILVGTPLVGLTFDELPGDGSLGFLAIGGLAAAATLALRWVRAPPGARS